MSHTEAVHKHLWQLWTRAGQNTMDVISKSGNRPNDTHREALGRLTKIMVELLVKGQAKTEAGEESSMVAVPLATGMGKSQTAIGLVRAMHQTPDLLVPSLSVLERSGIVIMAERLEDLNEMKQDLVSGINGVSVRVPEELIGFFHTESNTSADKLSIAHSSLGKFRDYPILLVSHAMVASRGIEQKLAYPKNVWKRDGETYGKRGLVIWDEALIRSKASVLTMEDIRGGLALLKVQIGVAKENNTKPEILIAARDALDYLTGVASVLTKDEARQIAGRPVKPVAWEQYATLRAEDVSNWDAAIQTVFRSSQGKAYGETLCNLIDATANTMRVWSNKSGNVYNSLITVSPRIPRGLLPLVVLDATCSTSQLAQLDPDMVVEKKFIAAKSFRNVDCTIYDGGTGNDVLSQTASRERLFDRVYAQMQKVVNPGEKILICTKKARSANHNPQQHFREYLDKKGYPLDTVENLTWGQHRATSKYKDCKHIFCIGLLIRPLNEIAGAVAGELFEYQGKEGLTDPRVDSIAYLREVQKAESVVAIIQLIGRGTARTTVDGFASPMSIHIFGNDTNQALRRQLEKGVHEMEVGFVAKPETVRRAHGKKNLQVASKAKSAHKTEELEVNTKAVLKYLKGYEGTAIRRTALREAAGLSEMHNRDWKVVVDSVLETGLWAASGRLEVVRSA